jgi:hypothetical protein
MDHSMNLEPELRETSDALLANLDRLRELEVEKRQLPLDSPRLVELATEIEVLASTVLRTTDRQTDLAKITTKRAGQDGFDGTTTIEKLPPARDVHAVLAEWREAERRLADLPADSTDAAIARSEIRALREEYRRAHDAAARRGSSLD